mmetsp:Transcript_3069/g.9208  ORF Transcript_3069/g.9208 Transcript_3069/m.9208 type:complete len:218 (+) Transcript_3069:3960-4613(+)
MRRRFGARAVRGHQIRLEVHFSSLLRRSRRLGPRRRRASVRRFGPRGDPPFGPCCRIWRFCRIGQLRGRLRGRPKAQGQDRSRRVGPPRRVLKVPGDGEDRAGGGEERRGSRGRRGGQGRRGRSRRRVRRPARAVVAPPPRPRPARRRPAPGGPEPRNRHAPPRFRARLRGVQQRDVAPRLPRRALPGAGVGVDGRCHQASDFEAAHGRVPATRFHR